MRRKIIFICLVSAIGMIGCGKQPVANKAAPSPTEEKVQSQVETSAKAEGVSDADKDFAEHFNEFTIDGTTISLPCSAKELIDAGFVLEGSDTSITKIFDSDDSLYTWWHWKDNEKATFGIGLGYSKGRKGDPIPLEEGNAVSISWDTEYLKNVDFTLYGGINADSTIEDVAKALGEEPYADGNFCRKYLDKHKHKGIDVGFYEGKLSEISISNYTAYDD